MVSLLVLGLGCTQRPPASPVSAVEVPAADARRPFAPEVAGAPVQRGVSYGPYREGQRPGGPDPTAAQIREDLHIIARHWGMLRVYASGPPTETILRTIRDEELPLQVLLGAWIAPSAPDTNEAEVSALIRLANAFPDVVAAVSVGNETQVSWSAHRLPAQELIAALRRVRGAVAQPVSTADDYNFWNKPESVEVAAEVDYLLLHAYAMWNRQSLDDAVPWTRSTVASIRQAHPSLTVVLGETGWATVRNPEAGGDQATQIVAAAGEDEQTRFTREFLAWTAEDGLPFFLFEAFDEPWKGGDDPREVEKHWGLYRVDRTPKPVVPEALR